MANSIIKKYRPKFLSFSLALRLALLAPLFLMTLGFSSRPALALEDSGYSYADMSLKELMSLQVFSAASLIPTELSKAPGTAYSFNRGDFDRLGARRLDDLLRQVPGFQLNQYRKRHNTIWARGVLDRYNDKMALFVDGIPVRSVYYGHFATGDNIPLENVETVEILLGPASSLYGANAFGGVISITTRDFGKEEACAISAEGASNNRSKGAVSYRGDAVTAYASHITQKAAYSEDRISFIGSSTTQPLDEDYSWFYMKAKPVEGLTLIADYQQNNIPFLFMAPPQSAFIEERPMILAAKYENGDIGDGRFEFKAHYSADKILEYYTESSIGGTSYREHQDATAAGANASYFRKVGDRHTITFGASWSHNQAEDMGYTLLWHYKKGLLSSPQAGSLLSDPNAGNDDYAAFVQDVWSISDELTLTFGGRYDQYQAFGNHPNYRGALVWAPSPDQVVKVLYGTAIRTPSYREYLKVMEGTDFIPPIPKPEKMTTLEAGYSRQWEKAGFSATVFQNRFENYIKATPTPDGADEYFANSDEIWTMSGAEALLLAHPSDGVQARLWAAYLKTDNGHGSALPYLAQLTAGLDLSYQYIKGHSAGFGLFHNSGRADTNDYPEDNPDSFLLLNFTASGKITGNLGYWLGVDNLLDTKVYDPAAEFDNRYNPQRSRREIWLKLEYSFKH